MSKEKFSFLKRLFLSDTMVEKNASHRIAYVAIFTALCILENMFFEIPSAHRQISLTLFISALTGIIIGPLFGFAASFLGDLLGFLYKPLGMYTPWVGIAMGMTAMIAGLIMNGLRGKGAWFLYVKLGLVCLLSLTISTILINTTAFWKINNPGVDYQTYLWMRLFVQGQIWNCLVNYLLLFICVPALTKVKPLKIKIR